MLLVSDASSSVEGGRFVTLTWEDDMEVHALRKRGWSIPAIPAMTANTVRMYLTGDQKPD